MFKSRHRIYLEHKEAARYLVKSRLAWFNQFYGWQWGRIAIRDQRARWGSCSSKSNLNFNYRLILLPLDLADYIIVHEMCHLAEMNHGRNFWSLVARTIPDWRQRRRRLKQIPIK